MFKLRNYQKSAIKSIFSFFRKKEGKNPLICAPTGSGKSYIIAGFCEIVVKKWPDQKILIISHSKKILSQDHKAISTLLPNIDIGLYSAGLNSRDIKNITIAGIQSIYNKPEFFEQFNLIIVDECHKIPFKREGIYHKFFKTVQKPVIGLTATPFRLGGGYLHLGDDKFFDDIIYDISYNKLLKEGHLCKLTTKGTKKKLNADGIKKQSGDYVIKELSKAFDRERVTREIVQELLLYKETRKKWLIFAIDIKHCEHIDAELNRCGIKTVAVHSKKKEKINDSHIKDFEQGNVQCLVSVAKLTTGFDVPDIDLIALCRGTLSPVLHVQMIGRGTRLSPGKENCLILDFAGNIMKNGPIDDPIIRLKGGDGSGDAAMKECPECFEIVYAATRVCPSCQHEFLFRHNLKSKPDESNPIKESNWFKVDNVKYFRYTGSRNIPMLKVSYFCGLRRFNEYVCFEHGGYATRKAFHWWSIRSNTEPPIDSKEALDRSSVLSIPLKIKVETGGKYDNILDYEFKDKEK